MNLQNLLKGVPYEKVNFTNFGNGGYAFDI